MDHDQCVRDDAACRHARLCVASARGASRPRRPPRDPRRRPPQGCLGGTFRSRRPPARGRGRANALTWHLHGNIKKPRVRHPRARDRARGATQRCVWGSNSIRSRPAAPAGLAAHARGATRAGAAEAPAPATGGALAPPRYAPLLRGAAFRPQPELTPLPSHTCHARRGWAPEDHRKESAGGGGGRKGERAASVDSKVEDRKSATKATPQFRFCATTLIPGLDSAHSAPRATYWRRIRPTARAITVAAPASLHCV